jgi:hypothetical protein
MPTSRDTTNDDKLDIPGFLDRRREKPASAKPTEVASVEPSAGDVKARYALHALCQLFPKIEGPAFDELVQSIKDEGLRERIVLHDGAILDGRNRYDACLVAGVEPVFVPFRGDDPVRFVLAANIHRRHLSENQRALIAAKLATLARGSNQHHREDASIDAPSQSQAAEMLNVSRSSVQRARQVLEHAAPEDVKAIREGRATLGSVTKKLKRKSKKQKEPPPPVSSKSKPQLQPGPKPKRDAEGPPETGAVDAPAEMMIARLDLVAAENRALLEYINNHASDIDKQVAVAAAKAARISRGVHERVRTLAATNRNRARARRQNAADPKDDEH